MSNKKVREKKLKTKEERMSEINPIKAKLDELGLSLEFEGIKQFHQIINEYVENGISWSGVIKLNGLKRVLEASLPMRHHVKCTVNLKYDENV